MSRSLTQNDGMDFIIRNAAATERDLLASTREPTRHRRAFSAFRPNLSRSTYSNLLSDCTKSLDKKNIVLQSSFSEISTYSLFLLDIHFFSLPTLCYYVAGKKTFSSKEIKHVQQPLLRYSTKNNLWEKIYRCHPCYVLEFGQLVVTNYKECNRQSNHQI